MKIQKLLYIFCCLTLMMQSCKKDKKDEYNLSNPKLFIEYINSFTGGVISSKAPIDIVLQKNIGDWEVNQELDEGIITIYPQVKGKVYFMPNNVIRFEPSERLKQDQKYKVTFNLGKITEVEDKLKKFTFTFMTLPQTFATQFNDLQSIDDNTYILNGTFTASDWITAEQVKKVLLADQNGEKLDIQINADNNEEAKEFFFIINKIKRLDSESILTLVINGKTINANQRSQETYTVPQKNKFYAFNYQSEPSDDQSFWINFSDPLKKNQNFEGLIVLEGINNKLTYTPDGNLLKIYSDAPLKNEVILKIYSGIQKINDGKTTESIETVINFGVPKPEIKLIKSGTILPSSENLKINFQATTLKAVDVKIFRIFENNVLQFLQENNLEGDYSLYRVASPIAETTIKLTNPNSKALLQWNSYALDLSTLINPEPGAIYHIEFSMRKEYSLYTCEQDSNDDADDEEDNYYDEDEDDYYESYYYYYNWEEKDDPCTKSYYYYKGKVKTNILATDLGVIAKRGNNNTFTVAVTDLLTTEPVGAATVEFYSFQQQLIASSKTDSFGMLSLNLNKKDPAFIVVKSDRNTTYLKVDNANALSMSNYDVDGVSLTNGINGFIYTERGVWRPGDDIYIGFILDDKANPIPNNHPIKLTLSDPYGKLVDQIVRKKNNTNHYTFQLNTSSEAPTGNWSAVINVGGVKFYKSIKVETIKPNRLKIKNNIEGKIITKSNNSKVDYDVQWLQGGIARNLKADVTLKLLRQNTTFSDYKNYNFNNSLSSYNAEEINVFSGRTNENGKFSFNINLTNTPRNAGMLKAIFTAKVYENGGDMSTDVSTATLSPYDTYVGIKLPKANKYNYYETEKDIELSFVKVNEHGKPKSGDIKIDVYRKTGYWWWNSGNNGISNYSTSSYHSLVESKTIFTNNGTTTFKINIPEQDWGRYEIVATDVESGHIASQQIFVDWPYWSAKSKNTDGKEATSLSIATDKKDYNTGETVKVSFPSSEGGRALISIESGTSVVQTEWIKTQEGETTYEFITTPAMSPNAYINIISLQPHASTINNSPIRMYGVENINVYDKNTKLEPQIIMPDKLKPEQEFTLKIQEKEGKKMTYTIAIVEDGLLDLTRFKTPNPWNTFYSKTALGVRTWDMYNDVIGAYGGSINQVFSIGGDEDLGAGQVKKANRFKPVVIFKGPFTLEAGKTATHTIKLPKYIGSVRVMVVGSNASTQAYGSAEKTVKVNNPLMILGSLPRRAVPGEKVTLPVTVFAMEKHVKNVTIKVKTDDKFKLLSNNTQTLQFSEPDEKIAYFDLEVLQKLGISKISIEATSGAEKASYDVELDVINPNPITVRMESLVLNDSETKSIDWNKFGIPGSNDATLELSTFPGINLTSRLKYLLNYPHGCSEQITSGVFPQLYLADFTTLNESKKTSIQRNVSAGIAKLAERQMSNGGFKYWPNSSYADDWATSYIGHFLLEAEKKGYALPLGSKANWLTYQQKEAKNWRFEPKYHNDFAQAYRLYTLALAGSPDLAAMNRLRETIGISNNSKLRLAAAYAIAGQKEAANKLIANIKLTDQTSNYYYYGSYERNLAMALETELLLNPKAQLTHEYANKLAKELGSNSWMSTQSTAFGLYAMSKYIAKNKTSDEINAVYNLNNKAESIKTSENFTDINLSPIAEKNTISVTNNSKGTLYAKVITSGILPIGQEIVEQSKLRITTAFQTTTGATLNPTKIVQGTEFVAYITITNTSGFAIQNVALTQVIPSGWEIINLRYTDAGGNNNAVNYTDIRDDRTQFYFSLGARASKTLKISLNASYLGHYYLPGVYANAMYDNSYSCRTSGMWIDVIKE